MGLVRLEILISAKQEQMLNIGKQYGLCHHETVKCSQELDVLLNLYMKEKGKSRSTTPLIKS